MKCVFDIDSTCGATVTNRCQLSMVEEVFKCLDDKHKELFKKSCFGHLLAIKPNDLKLSSQIIHGLLRRAVKSSGADSVRFKINEKICRFGLQEFGLVSGLKVADEGDEYRVLKGSGSVLSVFENVKAKRGKITRGDLFAKFNRDGVEPGLKYKLGLLTVLHHVVLAVELDSDVNEKWIHLVEDLDKFNKYPWGNLCFKHTVKIFKRKTLKVNSSKGSVQYSMHGFPWAIMIWAFEAFPEFKKVAKFTKCPPGCPRINGWHMKKQLKRDSVDIIFNGVKSVQRTLEPNDDEVEAPYFKELTLVEEKFLDGSDEEDDTHGDGENDESGEEEKNDGDRNRKNEDVPSTSSFNGRHFDTKCIERVVRAVVKEEMLSFFEQIDMKMNKFMESIKSEIFRSNGKEDDETIRKEDEFGLKMEGGDTYGGEDDNFDDERRDGEDVLVDVVVRVEEDCSSDDKVSPMIPNKNQVENNEIPDKVPIELDDIESPKGRGYRKKRKTAILGDPWTNPGKRRKFENVEVYDPFRVVDPAKLDDLNKWMSTPDSDSAEVENVDLKCASGPVGKAFFKKIVDVEGWLTGEHVDAALYLIRERALTYPSLFRQDCAIMDSSFVPYVRMYFKQVGKEKSSELPTFSNALVRYVQGEIPKFGKSWANCRKLYVPFCNEKMTHWLALEIDLTERCIRAHDSQTSIMRKSVFEQEMEPLRVVIPMLMQMAAGDANYDTKKFDLIRPKSPIQTNGADCGMFTIKFVEFLQARLDVKDVDGKLMLLWRQKLAAEVFADHFDP